VRDPHDAAAERAGYVVGMDQRAASRSSSRVAASVHWTLSTKAPPSPLALAVKGGCTDISKRRLEAASRAVLGYGAGVDPRRFEGACVRKSDENGVHDGVVVAAPIARPDAAEAFETAFLAPAMAR
jgi:hypothetical protein